MLLNTLHTFCEQYANTIIFGLNLFILEIPERDGTNLMTI